MKAASLRVIGSLALMALVALLTTACDDFLLAGLLDGESGQPLSVSPQTTDVAVNTSVTFTAAGGFPPYAYRIVSGDGALDSEAGRFTAPGVDGETEIEVTDFVGNSVTALVHVVVPATSDVSYRADDVTMGSGTAAGGSMDGYFFYSNVGTQSGTHPITYQVFASVDSKVDYDLDYVVAGGSTPALDPSGTQEVHFNGTWPTTPGTYYLILLLLTTPDDLTSSDNVVVSGGPVTVSGPLPPQVDYAVYSVSATGSPAVSGDSINETFIVYNFGPDDGTTTIYWNAYISVDDVLDGSDTPIDNGSTASVNAGIFSTPVTIDQGMWPMVDGTTYLYLIVQVSAADDVDPGNNSSPVLFWVDPPNVNYAVTSVPNPGAVEALIPISDWFSLANYGSSDGHNLVSWTVYVSADPTLDAWDTVVDNGVASPLSSGGSTSIPIDGYWPDETGTHWVIVTVSAPEEVDPADNMGVGSSFEIMAAPGTVDYLFETVSRDYPTVLASSSTGEWFEIRNASSTSGVMSLQVEIDLSDDAVAGGDTYVTDFYLGSLPAGSLTGRIDYTIDWPVAPGTYYIVATIISGDDVATNNTVIQGPFQVNDAPDYEINPSFPAFCNPDGYNNGNTSEYLDDIVGAPNGFNIYNAGAGDGHYPISWQFWVSTDAALDGGDTKVFWGTETALPSGMPAWESTNVQLPAISGEYYLIATISSPDDANPTNNIWVSPAILVWDLVNPEGDMDQDDCYPGQEDDYFIVLDAGDTVTISGIMDYATYGDLFMIRTGGGVTSIHAVGNWTTGNDAMDFRMYRLGDDPNSPPYESAGLTINTEDTDLTTPWTAVSAFDRYYFNVVFATVGNESQPYTVTITALP